LGRLKWEDLEASLGNTGYPVSKKEKKKLH
jgi:hypothetical protein